MSTPMITTSGLVKRYGKVTALDGIDFSVPAGTVLGLLGPNGAGKTTAVRILTTLLDPDEGEATVAGMDVRRNPAQVRERIGLSGQNAAIDEHLTGFENLRMVGQLYGFAKAKSSERSRELLEQFELTDAADRPSKTYSGGMARRLDLAAALVAKPPVLFLDEPTTGLDPRSRSQLWVTIRGLVSDGTTVLLTTQYMEEADRLCDDIVVIDHGRIIAQGTPDQLKLQIGGERIEVVVESAGDLASVEAVLKGVSNGDVRTDEQARLLTAPVEQGVDALAVVLGKLDQSGVHIQDIGVRRPTLDDVFLTLTGHAAEREANADAPADKAGRQKERVR